MLKYLAVRAAVLFFLLCSSMAAYAQLPDCNNIYLKKGDEIYNYNPLLPVSATNPAKNTIPCKDAFGLTISHVLNSGNPTLTFYTVDSTSGAYAYYDPLTNTWVNTGHKTGSLGAVNIAAGGKYIFNLEGITGAVYRYDGSGPGKLIATVPNFGGLEGAPYDLVTDCEGNWYVLNLRTNNPFLKKYNADGTLLHSWVVYNPSGISTAPSAGFAIIGTTLYTDNATAAGGITTYSMGKDTLEVIADLSDPALLINDDFGCCAGNVPTRPEVAIKATKIYLCKGSEPVSFSADPLAGGTAPVYQWLVNGTVVSSGASSYTYSPAHGDEIVCIMTSNSPCASPPTVSSDTIRMVVYNEPPKAPVVVSPVLYCKGDIPVPLAATKSVATNKMYWYTADTGGVASLTAPVPGTERAGTFTYYVSEADGDCESARIPITVIVIEAAIVDVQPGHPTTLLGQDGFIRLKTNKANEVYKVTYYKDNDLQPERILTSDASGYITISDLGEGMYTAVTIMNSSGCVSSAYNASIQLSFCDRARVPMPNSFTPNGDHINDVFYVRGGGFTVKNFRIYNRWGELVFQRENFPPNDPQYGWDGKMNAKVISETAGFVYMLETVCVGTDTPLLTKGTVLMIK